MGNFNLFLIKKIIKLYDYLYYRINVLATRISKGVHPKHKIMKYHEWFLNNIDSHSKILDVGCGIGALTYDLSKKADKIIAIDISQKSIDFAQKRYYSDNIIFMKADINEFKFDEKFDYIILSSVLEHIKDRKSFLRKFKTLSNYILIRVPMINRSWLTLYKKDLGLDYRRDRTHFIEYTLDSFMEEMSNANLKIISYSIQFGEIWAKIQT